MSTRRIAVFISGIVLALGSAAFPQSPPKSAPAGQAPSGSPVDTHTPRVPIVTEGFEGGVMPPTGWTRQVQNAAHSWVADPSAHAGSYGARVTWDFTQDEWLVSPQFNISGGTLTLWSMGSVYWCRDNFNNCDLQIWLVVGAVGGGDDILVGTAETSWTASWTWAQSSFTLTAAAGPKRLAFRYFGNDGADAHLDDILLDGIPVPVELMRIDVK